MAKIVIDTQYYENYGFHTMEEVSKLPKGPRATRRTSRSPGVVGHTGFSKRKDHAPHLWLFC